MRLPIALFEEGPRSDLRVELAGAAFHKGCDYAVDPSRGLKARADPPEADPG